MVVRKYSSLASNVVCVYGVLICVLVSFISPSMSEVNIATLNINEKLEKEQLCLK